MKMDKIAVENPDKWTDGCTKSHFVDNLVKSGFLLYISLQLPSVLFKPVLPNFIGDKAMDMGAWADRFALFKKRLAIVFIYRCYVFKRKNRRIPYNNNSI